MANVYLAIDRCAFERNFALLGGGIYLGGYNDGFSVGRSLFDGNSGDHGAGVYITQFNTYVAFSDLTMRGNKAVGDGGALYVLSDDISITSSRIVGNTASSGGGVYSLSHSVDIVNCTLEGNRATAVGGGVFMEGAAVASIKGGTYFRNNTAGSGGALSASHCSALAISDCEFQGNAGTRGEGGAVILVLSTQINVANCVLTNNTAQGDAGAMYVQGCDGVNILNCTFDGNSAVAGSGSALWLSSSDEVSIRHNAFYRNRAAAGGGTVYWQWYTMLEPTGIENDNYFDSASNSALYASTVGTEVFTLRLDERNVYNVTDYTSAIPLLTAFVVDYYGQVVLVESSGQAVASALGRKCADSDGYITGGFLEGFESGVVAFESLHAYCDPGYSMSVSLSATIGGISLQTSFDLTFRDCVLGEYYSDSICIPCETGTYSTTDPQSVGGLSELGQASVCSSCPEGSAACYGGVVALKPGYWRLSREYTTFLHCPLQGSCGGGAGVGDELCTAGYVGNVCFMCYIYRSIVILYV
jgi:parallel beta-helix repeat protein/predicted outer membrane repeat protein